MNMQCAMTLEKETKGAVRYVEKGDPNKHILRTMYIRKSAFAEEDAPSEIQVTIESIQ